MSASLSKLLNPHTYQTGLWILTDDLQARNYWKDIFSSNLANIANLINDPLKREMFVDKMTEIIEAMSADVYKTVHEVTVERESLLNRIGVPDPYKNIKDQENRKALACLQPHLEYLDSLSDQEQTFCICLSAVVKGNQFDLGSKVTADLWRKKQLNFNIDFKVNPGYKKYFSYFQQLKGCNVTVLVDNAGFDYLIGSVSFIRFLLNSGFSVTVAANNSPALNDVTYREVIELNKKLDNIDRFWKKAQQDQRLKFISSGCKTPGINLKKISTQLNQAVNRSDLLILIGQGRAIETTLNAVLDINVFRIAKVKDYMVASYIGQPQLSDFICWTKPGEEFID
ncbi:MAG: ARMT1-like domain-containing protein [bacterium]